MSDQKSKNESGTASTETEATAEKDYSRENAEIPSVSKLLNRKMLQLHASRQTAQAKKQKALPARDLSQEIATPITETSLSDLTPAPPEENESKDKKIKEKSVFTLIAPPPPPREATLVKANREKRIRASTPLDPSITFTRDTATKPPASSSPSSSASLVSISPTAPAPSSALLPAAVKPAPKQEAVQELELSPAEPEKIVLMSLHDQATGQGTVSSSPTVSLTPPSLPPAASPPQVTATVSTPTPTGTQQTPLSRIIARQVKKLKPVVHHPISQWKTEGTQTGADPLRQGIKILMQQGANSALFLAISSSLHPTKPWPVFKAIAAVHPLERAGLWTGLIWDPTLAPELWSSFLSVGHLDLGPDTPGNAQPEDAEVSLSAFRLAFGAKAQEWLLLVRTGEVNSCSGLVVFFSDCSLTQALELVLPMFLSAAKSQSH